MTVCCAFLFLGCGSSSDVIPINGITPAQNIGKLSSIEDIIYSEGYAGYLVVHLSEEAGSRKQEAGSKTNPPSPPFDKGGMGGFIPSILQPTLSAHPTAVLKRSVSTPPEQVTARRLYLEKLSGQKLADFNLIYHIEVSDPDEAVLILHELQNAEGVDMVYPMQKGHTTTLATVPDLTGTQGYLYANETHGGLNAQAAWDAGARGAGIVIVDAESEWNYAHEDLNLQWGEDNWCAMACRPDGGDYCRYHLGELAHGTAVAGIISAYDNGHGITGFVPDADLKTTMPDTYTMVALGDGDEENGEIPPGSVFLIEFQHAGILSGGSCSGSSPADEYGCIPFETIPVSYNATEYLTAAGITVVAGAGNGSVDLGDPATYRHPYNPDDPEHPDPICATTLCEVHLYDHDSDSIIVGGSQGPNHRKISFSDFGSPVRTYAWAQGVVTTSYPYEGDGGAFLWTPIPGGPNPPNDDPNAYYTNNFGGTSSAAAMVAGAAALIQSYAKNRMGEPTRYIMPRKLRDILTSTGVRQTTIPPGAPYQVCPGVGVHMDAGPCPAGNACLGVNPAGHYASCRVDSDCEHYGGTYTLSPQCVGGWCGVTWCAPRCGDVSGRCAGIGWSELTVGGDCYCQPPLEMATVNGNIGTQPRIDQAMAAVDAFWGRLVAAYPELISGDHLTEARMLTLRQDEGLGLICGELDVERHEIIGPNDPSCPDVDPWVAGTMIAKSLDFDGDGRADLVSWTNGTWKVDLSSVGSGGDNFGTWDLELDYSPIEGRWVWPYVEDFNSDGREDFAVYDKEHGKWYIKFTNSTLLNTGVWPGWDWEIDYSAEWHDDLKMDPLACTTGTGPNCSDYSRPAPGDYNYDGWIDIAIACSDGYWRIDYGGASRDDYGVFDQEMQYLNRAQLIWAPGWAFLATSTTGHGFSMAFIAYKIPDGLAGVGRMVAKSPRRPDIDNLLSTVTTRFGGNDVVPLLGHYNYDAIARFEIGLKNSSGLWSISSDMTNFSTIDEIPPAYIYGNLNCRPVVADFDGDDYDDRTVMCPNEWRIAYSSDTYETAADGARHVPLAYDPDEFALPGRTYSGGISYSLVQQLIAYAQETNPTQPSPIPVDMATMSVCSLSVDDPEGECR